MRDYRTNKTIEEMNEQELVTYCLGDIQNACNIPPIAEALKLVTRRLRDLGLNGNDHIAMRWLIDKLYSLVGREVDERDDHERALVDHALKTLRGE